jgi:Calx-beta domain
MGLGAHSPKGVSKENDKCKSFGHLKFMSARLLQLMKQNLNIILIGISSFASDVVFAAPVNDNFASRIVLAGQTNTNTTAGSNVGATKETGEPNHAGNSGGHSVWWTWTSPTSGVVTFDTFGSSFDTLLAIYTGSSVSALIQVAANDDSNGSYTSLVTFNAVAGTVYQIAVDGYGGNSGSIVLEFPMSAALPGVFQFSSTSFTVNENETNATLSVLRLGGTLGNATVDYTTVNDSAIGGQDFISTSSTLQFTNGQDTETILVPLINDSLPESQENFSLQLSNPTGGSSLGSPTAALVTIVDDDSPPTVQWDTTSYAVNENAGYALLTLRRNGGSAGVQVAFATSNLTALAGLDYVATNGVVTFAPNEAFKTLSVTIIDDYPIEGDESFYLRLFNPVGAALGAISNATVTIHDSDYSPEDLYGHRLYIVSNINFYPNNGGSAFSNHIAIYNSSDGASRAGYVALTETTGGIYTDHSNSFPIPSIPGQSTYGLDVGGYWSVSGNDGNIYNIYATVYETSGASSLISQMQDSQWIYRFDGTTAPPGGGPVTLGSGSSAPGTVPPPLLTNAVVAGPLLIEENSNAVYTAKGFFNDGTVNASMSPTWTSTAFSISQAGKLTASSVQVDTPVTISGKLSFGNTITKTFTATVVNVQPARLQGLGMSNQQFRLQLAGTTGRRYAIETATNLTGANNWIAFTTNQIFSNSFSLLNDPASTNSNIRFYRARQTP